MDNLYSENED